MTKTVVKWQFFSGLDQTPKDLDFHITPVLTLGQSSDEVKDVGSAWGLFLEWGYWAFGIAVYTAKLD